MKLLVFSILFLSATNLFSQISEPKIFIDTFKHISKTTYSIDSYIVINKKRNLAELFSIDKSIHFYYKVTKTKTTPDTIEYQFEGYENSKLVKYNVVLFLEDKSIKTSVYSINIGGIKYLKLIEH